MGFRTVMITSDCYLNVPRWFVDKWGQQFNFGAHGLDKESGDIIGTPISSKWERKFYGSKDEEVFSDLQKVLLTQTDRSADFSFEIVLFHECRGITKVHIGKDFIRMYEPSEWHEVDEITHDYCYGCSTPEATDLPDEHEAPKGAS